MTNPKTGSPTELDHLSLVESDLTDLRLRLVQRRPADLYEPVSYVLEAPGKRIRPLLVHLTASALGADLEVVRPLAIAVEVFHNFTLVHDDIMDNAGSRRGRPTVHVQWSESTAILAGDLLLGLSYELIARSPAQLLQLLLLEHTAMVARLCEGQTTDMEFERRGDVGLDEYLEMIDSKTGALLECCFLFGGIAGGAAAAVLDSLRIAGREMGRAFQIQDDLLDLVATDPKWGKTRGGDLIEGKKAYLLLRALESADDRLRSWGESVADSGLDPSRVDLAQTLLEEGGILSDAADAVKKHTRNAVSHLEVLPDGRACRELLSIIRSMADRPY